MSAATTDVSASERLRAARQRVVEAQQAVASLRGRAATGEQVDGAELAAASAAVELAELALPTLEAAAIAEQEQANADALERTVHQFLADEDRVVGEYIAARRRAREADQDLRSARATHAMLIGSFTARVPVTTGPVGPAYRPNEHSPAVIFTRTTRRVVQPLPDSLHPDQLAELEARYNSKEGSNDPVED